MSIKTISVFLSVLAASVCFGANLHLKSWKKNSDNTFVSPVFRSEDVNRVASKIKKYLGENQGIEIIADGPNGARVVVTSQDFDRLNHLSSDDRANSVIYDKGEFQIGVIKNLADSDDEDNEQQELFEPLTYKKLKTLSRNDRKKVAAAIEIPLDQLQKFEKWAEKGSNRIIAKSEIQLFRVQEKLDANLALTPADLGAQDFKVISESNQNTSKKLDELDKMFAVKLAQKIKSPTERKNCLDPQPESQDEPLRALIKAYYLERQSENASKLKAKTLSPPKDLPQSLAAIGKFLGSNAPFEHLQNLVIDVMMERSKHPERSQRENLLVVLEKFERECGFDSKMPKITQNLNNGAFFEMLTKKTLWEDFGAGARHGWDSHRLQWYLIGKEVQKHPEEFFSQ